MSTTTPAQRAPSLRAQAYENFRQQIMQAHIRPGQFISQRELMQLLGTLKSEVAELSKTHGEQAQSIAGFTEVSAHEATRAEQNPELLRLSLQGLGSSVRELEESHPRLVQIVNAISSALSNLGI